MTEREKYSKALGKSIRAFRESRNISLKEFEASQDFIDRHALSRIENGKTVPSAFTLYRICNAIKITQADLFLALDKEIKNS